MVAVTRWATWSAALAGPLLLTAVLLYPDPPATDPSPSGLRTVHAPGTVTADVQPVDGSCHYRTSSGQTLPDPACTPGAIDPAVTQATINSTICVSGWTATVRPSSSVTGRYERLSAADYTAPQGTTGEYDHLVPLVLGGANATSNLWPQPGRVPNAKDPVEVALAKLVCAGKVPLAEAQRRIATDWTTALDGLR